MTNALTFQSTQFDVIDRNNQPWLRGAQIEQALGYTRENAVKQLYDRHADEFTDSMTAVVTLPTPGGPQETRIFSLRGCHLLAMFARTHIAKEFRRWVLDVLETLNGAQAAPQPPLTAPDPAITPDQQRTLHDIVKAKVAAVPEPQRHGGLYPQIWGRFKDHFRLAKYDQLPQSRMGEAVTFLAALNLDTQPRLALPAAEPTIEERSAEFMQRLHALRTATMAVAEDSMTLFHSPFWRAKRRSEDHAKFCEAMAYAMPALVMSIGKNVDALTHLYTAYVEGEKMVRG